MASDRVISLPANQIDPDSSGAGAMLFDQLVKKPQELQQTDAIEAIKDKYHAASQARANDFDAGMANLRSRLHMAETQATWEHEQGLKQQEAQGLQTMVEGAAKSGVPMPGFDINQIGQAPEAGYAGETKAAPINPNALTEARSMWLENLKAHAAVKNAGDIAQLHRTLGLMDDNDAAQARQLADAFEAAGDTLSASKLRAGYGQAGLADHQTWQGVQRDYMGKLQVSQASIASKLAIAQEISARQRDIAQLKASVARATAQAKVDDKGFTELTKIHGGIQQQISRFTQMRNQLLQSQIMSDPAKAADYQSQIDNIDRITQDLNDQAAQVRNKMQGWQSAATGGPSSPAPIPPGTGGNVNPAVAPTPTPTPGGGTNWGKAQRIK